MEVLKGQVNCRGARFVSVANAILAKPRDKARTRARLNWICDENSSVRGVALAYDFTGGECWNTVPIPPPLPLKTASLLVAIPSGHAEMPGNLGAAQHSGAGVSLKPVLRTAIFSQSVDFWKKY